MKIGFIGLGIMGSRMAANLQRKGHELFVYNRTKEKARPLIARGAAWADTPADVARKSSIIFTMLARPDAVAETALLGKHGFLSNLPKNALWIDCSTVNPSFSKLMAQEAQERKVRFLDAPVAGSKDPAEHGQLVFFVGGDEADVYEAKPLLDAMGKAVIHIGKHGMGSSMKLVNNLILAQAMVAFSEAVLLGESLGVCRETLYHTLLNSPAAAPFLATKKSKLQNGNYEPDFPLQWMHKDLQLIAETAYENDIALPAGNMVKEIYALAKKSGLGEQDFSSVFRLLKGST